MLTTTQRELRERSWLGIEAKTEVCYNCKHFCRHYGEDGYLMYCGHCCYPRMKPRKNYDTCQYFENKHSPAA